MVSEVGSQCFVVDQLTAAALAGQDTNRISVRA
jgi:hypothetical protein